MILHYFINSLLFSIPREIRPYKGVIFLIILLEGKKLQADPDQNKTLHIYPVTETENYNKTTPLPDYIEDISEEYIIMV